MRTFPRRRRSTKPFASIPVRLGRVPELGQAPCATLQERATSFVGGPELRLPTLVVASRDRTPVRRTARFPGRSTAVNCLRPLTRNRKAPEFVLQEAENRRTGLRGSTSLSAGPSAGACHTVQPGPSGRSTNCCALPAARRSGRVQARPRSAYPIRAESTPRTRHRSHGRMPRMFQPANLRGM